MLYQRLLHWAEHVARMPILVFQSVLCGELFREQPRLFGQGSACSHTFAATKEGETLSSISMDSLKQSMRFEKATILPVFHS